MNAPPTRDSENLVSLWQSSSRLLHLRRQLSLPNLFYKEHGCPGPRMAQPYALCFPPSRSAAASTQGSQGKITQADSNSPPLEEPTVGVRVIPGAESSPVADPPETRPPLSSERHDMASTARVMGPAWVATRREPFVLPERVLNTMLEPLCSEMVNFLGLVSRPRHRPGHLRCVSGSFISAGDAG